MILGRGFLIAAAAVALLVPVAAWSAPAPAAERVFPAADAAVEKSVRDVVDAVSGEAIFDCIEEITTDVPYSYRLMGTPTHDLFIDKYGGIFTDRLGLASQVVDFEEGGPSGLPTGGQNVVAVLPGTSLTKWVVLGGHYDTRELTFGGGALDNTSGICTVFEIAKAFVELKLQPEATMVFTWWDGEEWGLYGARAFLEDHSATKELLGLDASTPIDFVSAVSFDMVGLNYPAYNTWVRYGEQDKIIEHAVLNLRTAPTNPENFTLCPSYGCYAYDEYSIEQLEAFVNYQEVVRRVAYDLLGYPEEHVWVYDDQYGRSDHVPFVAAGIPGMRVQGSHDEEFPHYHQPTDTIPGLILLAGSEDDLKAGFNAAADTGAAIHTYIGLKGTVGTLATGPLDGLDAPLEVPEQVMPGFEAVLLVGAVVVAVTAWRRRG